MTAIYDGLLSLLKSHNTLIGVWEGDFWGGVPITIGTEGDFHLVTTKGEVIDDGEIWVNLSDHTIDLKRI